MTPKQAQLIMAFIEANFDDRCADNLFELLDAQFPIPEAEMTPDEEQKALDEQMEHWNGALDALQEIANQEG